MRLAAKLTTMRDAARQTVALRGTLRDHDAAPRDVVILDVSTSGFRAELPGDVSIDPGTRVRIAATAFGVHEAIAVRSDGAGHGFAFVRPIVGEMLEALDREQPSSVTPFPLSPVPAPAAAATPADDRPLRSARMSLLLMVAISMALWLALAAIVGGVALLR